VRWRRDDRVIAANSSECAYQIAQVLAWGGERTQVLDWLERANEQQDSGLPTLKVNPLLRSLHADPRYVALLRKMNLPVD
jgi:hypothetical protein